MQSLLCNFRPIEVNDAGWKKHRCARCGFVTVFIPDLGQPVLRHCDVLPDGSRRPEPGTKLEELIAEIGVTDDGSCGCKEFAAIMNGWGPDGCRTNRGFIVERLMVSANERGWGVKFVAGTILLTKPWFRVGDPYGSLVDEAIRRAEGAARKTLVELATELIFGPPL